MSPEAVLGPALAEAIRELVRQELGSRAAGAAPASGGPERRPVTVPKAAKAAGVGEDAIKELLRTGRLRDHRAALNASRRRPTPLVDVDEVRAALANAGGADDEQEEAVDFGSKAAQIRARAEKRGG
jgi:hypothetical protein